MAHCVNKSSQEFKDLAEETKIHPVLLAAKISIWQEANGMDLFPTAEDLTVSVVHTEEVAGNTFSQVETVPASPASKETVEVMKKAAESMGINIMGMVDYAKGNPAVETKGINGVADLTKKAVGLAQGMEAVAITEEVVHIATAMIEQVDPRFITEMISKIDRFAIYKQVFEEYKGLKAYQLANGKPNIRKIKKEAVDKLIAELIINEHNPEGVKYPELMQEETASMIKRWWRTILDIIRKMYRDSNVDIYQRAAEIVASGELDASITPTEEGVYYETGEQLTGNAVVDKIYDSIKTVAKDMKLVNEDKAKKITRHYLYKGKRVAKSVTEMLKEKSGKKFKRTDEEKFFDDIKRDWGSKGHVLIEQFFDILIDKDGYKRATPLPDNITSELPEEVERRVKDYIRELVASYKTPGTRFLVENKVLNTKAKGLLASTVDLIIIEPITNKDGTKDAKVDVLDWKFTSLSGEQKEDIPWFKKKEWKGQMGEYSKILYNYGVTPKQLRKARMVPFIMNYASRIPGKPKSGLYPKSIEIGKLNSLEETNLYLLPVPINSETTGNIEIDKLVRSLNEQYEKMYKTPVEPEDKLIKDQRLNSISNAIRTLQMQLNFAPLVEVAESFFASASEEMARINRMKFDEMNDEQLDKVAGDLLAFRASASKYASLDKVYLSHYKREKLTPDEKKLFDKLDRISGIANRMADRISQIEHEMTISIANRENIHVEVEEREAEDDLESTVRIKAEIPVSTFTRKFSEASRIDASLVKLLTKMMKTASKITNIKYTEAMDEYRKILIPLERIASSRGKKAFDMIAKMTPEGLKLHRKYSDKFWTSLKDARSQGNKKFILDNIDQEKFKKLAEEAIDKRIERINQTTFHSDKEENTKIRIKTVERTRDSIDIFRKSFDGYDGYDFGTILNQVIKEQGNLSEEYKAMKATPEALKVWEYFSHLNTKAKQMGYLSKNHSTSFFPMIEATFFQKMANGDNMLGQLWDTIKDTGLTTVDEETNLAKIDPETGDYKREIPKYFTHTNKDVKQLSTDLTKVGALWIKSLMEYEKIQSLENRLLLIDNVEKTKGSIAVDKTGEIIRDAGIPLVVGENPTSAITRALIEDFAYGIREELDSLGNVAISTVTGKVMKSEEGKSQLAISTKKVIQKTNTYIQAMAVGAKPLIGAANYGGVHMHSFINAGTFYKYRNFFKNSMRVMAPGTLSTLEKALMMKIVPHESNLVTEEQRKTAAEKGIVAAAGTWTFNDVMMRTNSFGEERLQAANAITFIQNSMIVDGKVVPIRQYLKKQDQAKKYDPNVTYAERRALEKSLDARVEELKNTKSLLHTCKIENDKLVIPGVSDAEFAKFALLATEYQRSLNAQMNVDDKAGYKRDTLFNSFMMFRHWIPPLVSQRARDLKKNDISGEWEYGRMRAFAKTWLHLGIAPIGKMRSIVLGTPEGLAILDEMLEDKKEAYFKKTGKTLVITNEEFYDTMRKAIQNEAKELATILLLLGLVFGTWLSEPPEDATDLEKNRYKWWYKGIHKLTDELSFYYSPPSFEAITKGSVFPSVGLLSKVSKFGYAFSREAIGYTIDDQEMIDKSYPLKYFFNLVPVLYQLQTEALPYVDAELAKEMGIRVTAEARRQ